MESALSDLKKICDEVKDTLDPVILSSIETLIDKTYNALKDENEDARTLLEETLMRGVELVQKSKIGQDTLENLTNAAVEEGEGESTTEDESEGSDDSNYLRDEEERCDSPDISTEDDELNFKSDVGSIGTSITIGDNDVCVSITNPVDYSHSEHSYSLRPSPHPYPHSPVIRLKVDPPDNQSLSSRSLERLEETSKVITHSKVKKVLKSVNSSNPFVHRVSTATSTGLPKYMFTPRSGQIKSGVYKATTSTAVKPGYSKTKSTTTVTTTTVSTPPEPPSDSMKAHVDASTGTEDNVKKPDLAGDSAPPCVPPKAPKPDPPNTVVTKYTHQWTVAHFSKKMKMGNGKSIDSMFFSILVLGKKTDWSLMLYPNGDKDKVAGYVSLYLTCRSRKGLSMSLEFKFTILDSNGKSATAPTKSGSITAQMLATNSSWGWESFVKQDELMGHSLLPNDRLTICCDITLKCADTEIVKPCTKLIAVDNRDIDQLVDFVGEIEQVDEAPKIRKKGKKNKARKLVKDVEESDEAPEIAVLPKEDNINLVKSQKTFDGNKNVKSEDKPSEPPVEVNAGDFQVVTRRKVRKNSHSSSSLSGKSDVVVPRGKAKCDSQTPKSKATKVSRGFRPKVTPPRSQSSAELTPPKSVKPPRMTNSKIISKPIVTPPLPSTPSTACQDVTLHLSSLRLDTKESLSALLSTKTLLEENISRLTDLVDNKKTTINQIATDKVAKLELFSVTQEELQKKRTVLEENAVEQRKVVEQIDTEIEEVDLQLKKGGEKVARLTVYLDMNLADAESELARLGKEKDSLVGRLDMVEDKLRGNRQKERLLNIHNQILRLQTNLECPICLETAYNPIYQCREGHLVCSACVVRVARCAMCRQDGPVNIRNRYAENDSLELSRLLVERNEILTALTGE
eukprot:TRINITY_DN7522_c0_g1_i1.p1 TRINITY_DN7522_c0_g1~~TRINITY_DN7522_c0_g1_i1.p1  ORF type:complete len:909 (+),score=312.34 TRINITY_DN7522_c0_g1_i1:40-2766(+)